jgi:hypothetical protein
MKISIKFHGFYQFGRPGTYHLHRQEVVELTDPKLINEVAQTRAGDYIKSPIFSRVLKLYLGDGLSTSDGAAHKVHIQFYSGLKLTKSLQSINEKSSLQHLILDSLKIFILYSGQKHQNWCLL